MKQLNDTQVRASLRAALTRHRLDPAQVTIHCSSGNVRMLGALARAGYHAATPLRPQHLEALDEEIQHLPGVSRVHFGFRNWRRTESGTWTALSSGASQAAYRRPGEGYSMHEL